MKTIFAILLELLKNRFRSRSDLEVEIVALRQQVASLKAKNARPQIRTVDRLFWVLLSRFWPSWRRALLIVQPETVVGWHREGLRLYWRWKSQPKGGRPLVPQEVRDLIKRMASENPTCGAPRIHGELLMLGFDVAERSISRYLGACSGG